MSTRAFFLLLTYSHFSQKAKLSNTHIEPSIGKNPKKQWKQLFLCSTYFLILILLALWVHIIHCAHTFCTFELETTHKERGKLIRESKLNKEFPFFSTSERIFSLLFFTLFVYQWRLLGMWATYCCRKTKRIEIVCETRAKLLFCLYLIQTHKHTHIINARLFSSKKTRVI